MGDNTNIEWATHSWNFWTGCEPISPACAHCYAEAWAKRAGRDFAERRLTTEANRRKPLKWEANAVAFEKEHGHRQRIFVNSLADVFDNTVPQEWRDGLFETIRATPSLDYLLLTKRIGNAKKMLPANWGNGYPNTWIGATICNQQEADRDIPKLLQIRARVRFLSCEPLLESLNLEYPESLFPSGPRTCCDGRECSCMGRPYDPPLIYGINLVIVGGESGPGARRFDIGWAREIVAQCKTASVPAFVKQLGAVPTWDGCAGPDEHWPAGTRKIDGGRGYWEMHLRDRKGGDMAEWPIDLRVREFPNEIRIGDRNG